MIAVRERHMLMLGVLAIEERRNLELFFQGLSDPAAFASLAKACTSYCRCGRRLAFDVVAGTAFSASVMMGTITAIATRVNACFPPCLGLADTVQSLALPGNLDVIVVLRLISRPVVLPLPRRSLRSCSPLIFTLRCAAPQPPAFAEETGGRQVHARGHLDNTGRHCVAIAINDLVGQRHAADAFSRATNAERF